MLVCLYAQLKYDLVPDPTVLDIMRIFTGIDNTDQILQDYVKGVYRLSDLACRLRSTLLEGMTLRSAGTL